MIQSKAMNSANSGLASKLISSSLPLRSIAREASSARDNQGAQTSASPPRATLDSNSASASATNLLKRVDAWTSDNKPPFEATSVLEKLRRHNDVLADQARSLKKQCMYDKESYDAGRKHLLQQIKWLMDDLDSTRIEADTSPYDDNKGWASA